MAGRNALHGSIPGLFTSENITKVIECNPFSLSIQKLGINWRNEQMQAVTSPLTELRTLTLCRYKSIIF